MNISKDISKKIVDDIPELKRGKVWCRECGKEQKVDPAKCMQNGWPKCCGYTMTIGHPSTWED